MSDQNAAAAAAVPVQPASAPAPNSLQLPMATPIGVPLPGFGNLAELRGKLEKKRKEIEAVTVMKESATAAAAEEDKDEGYHEQMPPPAPESASINIVPPPPQPPPPPPPPPPSTHTADENLNTDEGMAKGVIEVGASKDEVEAHEGLKPLQKVIEEKRASLNAVPVKVKDDSTAVANGEAGPVSMMAQLSDRLKTRVTAMDSLDIESRLAADKAKAKADTPAPWLVQGKRKSSTSNTATVAQQMPASAPAEDDELKKRLERRKIKNGELPAPAPVGGGENDDGCGRRSNDKKPPPPPVPKKKKKPAVTPKPKSTSVGLGNGGKAHAAVTASASDEEKVADRDPHPPSASSSSPPPPEPEQQNGDLQKQDTEDTAVIVITDPEEFLPPPHVILGNNVQDGEEGQGLEHQDQGQQIINPEPHRENEASSSASASTPAPAPEKKPESETLVAVAVASPAPAPESVKPAAVAVSIPAPPPPPPPPPPATPASAIVIAIQPTVSASASLSSPSQGKAVTKTTPTLPASSPSGMPSNLLASIRAFGKEKRTLKKPNTANGQPDSCVPALGSGSSDLNEALRRAINERAAAIRDSDDGSDNESDDDADWN